MLSVDDSSVVSPGLTYAATAQWRGGRTGESKMVSLISAGSWQWHLTFSPSGVSVSERPVALGCCLRAVFQVDRKTKNQQKTSQPTNQPNKKRSYKLS